MARDWCRFSTVVRFVTYNEADNSFTVVAEDLVAKNTYTEIFDYVIVATGHFSIPNMPYFDGLENFSGRLLHAHDFRNALEFKDKDILIIGTSYSAEDIGSQCWKYGCKSVTVSYRTKPMGYNWPDNWQELPLLQKVENNICTFKDGTQKRMDAIILCTGYLHRFPFMENNLRLETNNRLWPLGLYKGVVWEKNPKLFYLGMQDQYYTFNMFDAQAWYVRDVIMERIPLPCEAEMVQNSAAWRERELSLADACEEIYFQGDYVKELIAATDYPRFNVDAVDQTFIQWKQDKYESIMGYRDKSYRSILTGTMQPRHHTAWVAALDDSMETYLQVKQAIQEFECESID